MVDLGVLGGALSAASEGYFKGLFAPSLDEVRAEREQKARDKEADIALKQAHALYYGRPQKGTGGVPDYLETTWGVYVKDPVTGQLELKHSKPPDTPKSDDLVKNQAVKVMETLRGKPFTEFGYEDFADEKVKGIMFDIYKMRPEIVTGPAGPNTRGDIYGAPRPSAAPTTTPPATTPPATTPPIPPEKAPPAQPPAQAKPRTKAQAAVHEQAVQGLMPGFEGMKDEELAPKIEELKKRQTTHPSPINLTEIEAAERVLAKRRGTPPTEPVAPVSSAQVPPKPPPVGSPAAAPQADSGSSRVVSPRIVSPEQLREQNRRARDQEIQEENVLRNRAADARTAEQLRLQQQGHSLAVQEARLRELDRQEDNRRADATLRLAEEKSARDIKELENANARKDEAAAFRVTQNILRETREARGMIQGADETVALIQEMRRYIRPETVGVKGYVRATWQSLWGQLDSSANMKQAGGAAALQSEVMAKAGKYQQEADKFGGTWQLEENARAKAEGREPSKIYIPDYSKYGYDPSMRFIDFLKEVIAYSHARAMNGPGRLTDQDLNRAQKSLGIDGWMNSAADMQTSLGYVEKQLKAKKERAQAYAKSVEAQLRKHRPGAVEAGDEGVPAPREE